MKISIITTYFFITTFSICTPLVSNINTIYQGARPTSEPYLSGDTFRKYCDHVFDVKNPNFDPAQVKDGDIIFLSKTDYNDKSDYNFIDNFFKNYHPLIKNKYILVTHNSVANITERFKKYLNNEKLFLWFAKNVAFQHPKLIPIPLGLENELWGKNYVKILNNIKNLSPHVEKEYLLYMNFNIETNLKERKPAYDYFKNKEFCHSTNRMNTEQYLWDVRKAKFVVSPLGRGLDCHRTWEALYLGVIPIVKKSSLDPLYEGLPVLIVNDWSEVTREFLEEKYLEITNTTYCAERLYINYWIDFFNKSKTLSKQ
jgi:hypothetical protein